MDRDTRFSKDKSPYKTNLGIHFRHDRAKGAHERRGGSHSRARDDRGRGPRSRDPEPAPGMGGGEVEVDATTAAAIDHEAADLHLRSPVVAGPEHEHLPAVDRQAAGI